MRNSTLFLSNEFKIKSLMFLEAEIWKSQYGISGTLGFIVLHSTYIIENKL